jgi:hypothetical protein
MKRTIGLLVAISVLVGCYKKSGLIGELPAINSNDFAEITIVWPWDKGQHVAFAKAITLDAKPIIQLTEGEYTVIRIPTGEHSLGMECCPKFDIGLDYKAERKYYYMVKAGRINYALVEIDRTKFIPLMKRGQYLSVENNIVIGGDNK